MICDVKNWHSVPERVFAADDRAVGERVVARTDDRAICFAPEMIEEAARASPDAPALLADCGTLSYGELDGRAARLAGWFRSLGVDRESLVGICLERSFDQVIVALAAWKAGAAYLPLDPAWPDARLRMIVDDAACALVVGRADVCERLAGAAATFEVLDWTALAVANGHVAAPPPVDPAMLAYVIYTSGTTGKPKGVEITHGNLAHLVAWHRDAFAVTVADRGTSLAGLGFDASVWEVWPCLCAGASVALAGESVRTSAEKLQEWLIAQRATIAFAPTALAEELVTRAWPADARLRVLLTGADRLIARPRPDLPFRFVNNYGPTECTVVATSAPVLPAAAATGLPPIGRPIGDTTLYLLDAAGDPVAMGEVGEIYLGGPAVARGYRHLPELTAERFVADRFGTPGGRLYRTGDLGARLPDGQIVFHGRIDEQVKLRGHRVEPEEVAQVLRGHPAIGACTVVARAADDGADVLVAYCVADGALTAEELRDFLGRILPHYMVPSQFVRLDALPFTVNGKLDKAALPPPGTGNALASAAFTAPQSPAEERLAAILADVLGHGRIGIDDNFFLLGGHSLLGTQVVLRAGDAFGVELALIDLFQAPTIRELAQRIEAKLLEMLEAMSDDEAQARAAE